MRSLLYDFAIGKNASPSIARECVRLARELRHIGINLNQIARALNSGAGLDPDTYADLRALLAKLVRVLSRIHDQLLDRAPPRRPADTPGGSDNR